MTSSQENTTDTESWASFKKYRGLCLSILDQLYLIEGDFVSQEKFVNI